VASTFKADPWKSNMNWNRVAVALLVFLQLGSRGFAQLQDPSELTVARIFNSDEFNADGFGPARWLVDGSGYTTLEQAESQAGRDIVRYDPATGRREVMVAAERLIPSGAKSPLAIADYAWSPDGARLLIFTNTRRVWRRNTRGDYWVLDLASNSLRKLGGDAEEATLMFAKFSPDGRRVAFVRQNNIYVEDIADGRITALTSDGARTLINGTFDWVYEEEWSLRDGFRWSPDGQSIAYWQLDSDGVRDFHLINNTDDLYSRIIPIPYPKVGERNSACGVGVVSAAGGDTRWMNVPGDPRDNYIARMDWAKDSDELILQHVNRLQNSNTVMLANARTGDIRKVLTDRDEAWVDVEDDLHWLDDGRRFAWLSERAGWRQLYVASRSGDEPRLITPGDYDVLSVEHVDSQLGWVYFRASPDNPTHRYLFRAAINGPHAAERLTPRDQPGTHAYQISPDSKWAFHTYSAFGTPPVIELVSLPDHRVVRTIVDNAKLRATVAAIKKRPSEFFRIDIGDGVELDGWCIKPPDFDAKKRYPLLVHVYGEPAGQTVLDQWGVGQYFWHLMLAQQGYIIVSVDNRGTPAPRGRAWRKSIYRQIGILASHDQAAALRAIKARWPFVNADRVGIWGWSGGGSMSLNAIFRYPDLYHTAIAIAFISDQRFYDTIYQERYMGLPADNPAGFRDGSPITFAHQLKGNLLLIHGTGDDNCHYQSCEALINKLIEANKPFTMMAYPNRTHSISEGKNTRQHLFELMTRYLNQNLPPGPRTSDEKCH